MTLADAPTLFEPHVEVVNVSGWPRVHIERLSIGPVVTTYCGIKVKSVYIDRLSPVGKPMCANCAKARSKR